MQLKLRPGKSEDIDAFAEIFFDAFAANPTAYLCFPRTSVQARDFWRHGLTEGFADPTARFVVVEDVSTSPPTVAAFAKWLRHPASGAYEPAPEQWPEDGDRELAAHFFGGLHERHEQTMGERPHWYLELIGTKKEYQGRGAGKMLVQWGCQQADEEGWEAYLDSSPDGWRLYEKCGFKVVETVDYSTEEYQYAQRIMLRDKKSP